MISAVAVGMGMGMGWDWTPDVASHGYILTPRSARLPELWFVVGFSQFHVAVLGEVEHDDEDGPHVLSADVQPRPRVRNPLHPHRELTLRLQRDRKFELKRRPSRYKCIILAREPLTLESRF